MDETDSGLDIDALKVVANGVNALRRPDRAIIVVTHYQRLLNYIEPDFVHVLSEGRIVKSGGKELALELEELAVGAGLVGRADGGVIVELDVADPVGHARAERTLAEVGSGRGRHDLLA